MNSVLASLLLALGTSAAREPAPSAPRLSGEPPGAVPAAVRIALPDGAWGGPGIPLQFTLEAVGGDGGLIESYEGFARLEGAVRFADGSPVKRAGPFRGGRLHLEGIELPEARIRAVLDNGAEGFAALPDLGGLARLLPPAIAICLALLTRQVLVSLLAGVWVGALLLTGWNPLAAFLRTADTYLVGAVADTGHAHIILFSFSLAGMVGVVSASGGIRGIVEAVSKYARGPRSGQVATWLLGVLIFFDDYANSLIVGNTMRPFTDRVRVSRERLSFIVDATAAPVATIGVISTWTAYQIGLVADELPSLSAEPANPYLFFLASIPYSFYSILMIGFVFLGALTLREFGPMLRAERRARSTGAVLAPQAKPLLDDSIDRLGDREDVKPRWINAAVPIACVILFTLAGLYWTGLQALPAGERAGAGLREIAAGADSYRALLWAAVGASLVAALLALRSGMSLERVADSWFQGARSLLYAILILVLAWSISRISKDVYTGGYVYALVRELLAPEFVPALSFITAGVIAFSTGTSYGTMGVLIPILLPLAYQLAAKAGLEPEAVRAVGLATLAAILGGSVFGDHCSPISDTTVLSSMASGADHIDHVRTQLPYALFVASACVPLYVLAGMAVPPAALLAGGGLLLLLVFFLLARPVSKAA